MKYSSHSYNPAHVIYGGATNTNLARTPHAHALRNFILDFNLTVCLVAPEAEVTYTFVSSNSFRFLVTVPSVVARHVV